MTIVEAKIVNTALDDILEKMTLIRDKIDNYGFDDDSIIVYDEIKEIIERSRHEET